MVRERIGALVALAVLLSGSGAFAQDRGGFTALVDAGVGVQNDSGIEETHTGLAGLSFGVGGFFSKEFALMFRLTGTTVGYDFGGAGWGFWSGDTDEDETGVGLILGTGVTLLNRGKHNLQFGVQYSPAFTDPGTVHSVGFTVGYQFCLSR